MRSVNATAVKKPLPGLMAYVAAQQQAVGALTAMRLPNTAYEITGFTNVGTT